MLVASEVNFAATVSIYKYTLRTSSKCREVQNCTATSARDLHRNRFAQSHCSTSPRLTGSEFESASLLNSLLQHVPSPDWDFSWKKMPTMINFNRFQQISIDYFL